MGEIPNTVFGLMALIITVQAGVIGIIFKMYNTVVKEKSDIQDARIIDAKETGNKIVSPIERLATGQELTISKIQELANAIVNSRDK